MKKINKSEDLKFFGILFGIVLSIFLSGALYGSTFFPKKILFTIEEQQCTARGGELIKGSYLNSSMGWKNQYSCIKKEELIYTIK